MFQPTHGSRTAAAAAAADAARSPGACQPQTAPIFAADPYVAVLTRVGPNHQVAAASEVAPHQRMDAVLASPSTVHRNVLRGFFAAGGSPAAPHATAAAAFPAADPIDFVNPMLWSPAAAAGARPQGAQGARPDARRELLRSPRSALAATAPPPPLIPPARPLCPRSTLPGMSSQPTAGASPGTAAATAAANGPAKASAGAKATALEVTAAVVAATSLQPAGGREFGGLSPGCGASGVGECYRTASPLQPVTLQPEQHLQQQHLEQQQRERQQQPLHSRSTVLEPRPLPSNPNAAPTAPRPSPPRSDAAAAAMAAAAAAVATAALAVVLGSPTKSHSASGPVKLAEGLLGWAMGGPQPVGLYGQPPDSPAGADTAVAAAVEEEELRARSAAAPAAAAADDGAGDGEPPRDLEQQQQHEEAVNGQAAGMPGARQWWFREERPQADPWVGQLPEEDLQAAAAEGHPVRTYQAPAEMEELDQQQEQQGQQGQQQQQQQLLQPQQPQHPQQRPQSHQAQAQGPLFRAEAPAAAATAAPLDPSPRGASAPARGRPLYLDLDPDAPDPDVLDPGLGQDEAKRSPATAPPQQRLEQPPRRQLGPAPPYRRLRTPGQRPNGYGGGDAAAAAATEEEEVEVGGLAAAAPGAVPAAADSGARGAVAASGGWPPRQLRNPYRTPLAVPQHLTTPEPPPVLDLDPLGFSTGGSDGARDGGDAAAQLRRGSGLDGGSGGGSSTALGFGDGGGGGGAPTSTSVDGAGAGRGGRASAAGGLQLEDRGGGLTAGVVQGRIDDTPAAATPLLRPGEALLRRIARHRGVAPLDRFSLPAPRLLKPLMPLPLSYARRPYSSRIAGVAAGLAIDVDADADVAAGSPAVPHPPPSDAAVPGRVALAGEPGGRLEVPAALAGLWFPAGRRSFLVQPRLPPLPWATPAAGAAGAALPSGRGPRRERAAAVSCWADQLREEERGGPVGVVPREAEWAAEAEEAEGVEEEGVEEEATALQPRVANLFEGAVAETAAATAAAGLPDNMMEEETEAVGTIPAAAPAQGDRGGSVQPSGDEAAAVAAAVAEVEPEAEAGSALLTLDGTCGLEPSGSPRGTPEDELEHPFAAAVQTKGAAARRTGAVRKRKQPTHGSGAETRIGGAGSVQYGSTEAVDAAGADVLARARAGLEEVSELPRVSGPSEDLTSLDLGDDGGKGRGGGGDVGEDGGGVLAGAQPRKRGRTEADRPQLRVSVLTDGDTGGGRFRGVVQPVVEEPSSSAPEGARGGGAEREYDHGGGGGGDGGVQAGIGIEGHGYRDGGGNLAGDTTSAGRLSYTEQITEQQTAAGAGGDGSYSELPPTDGGETSGGSGGGGSGSGAGRRQAEAAVEAAAAAAGAAAEGGGAGGATRHVPAGPAPAGRAAKPKPGRRATSRDVAARRRSPAAEHWVALGAEVADRDADLLFDPNQVRSGAQPAAAMSLSAHSPPPQPQPPSHPPPPPAAASPQPAAHAAAPAAAPPGGAAAHRRRRGGGGATRAPLTMQLRSRPLAPTSGGAPAAGGNERDSRRGAPPALPRTHPPHGAPYHTGTHRTGMMARMSAQPLRTAAPPTAVATADAGDPKKRQAPAVAATGVADGGRSQAAQGSRAAGTGREAAGAAAPSAPTEPRAARPARNASEDRRARLTPEVVVAEAAPRAAAPPRAPMTPQRRSPSSYATRNVLPSGGVDASNGDGGGGTGGGDATGAGVMAIGIATARVVMEVRHTPGVSAAQAAAPAALAAAAAAAGSGRKRRRAAVSAAAAPAEDAHPLRAAAGDLDDNAADPAGAADAAHAVDAAALSPTGAPAAATEAGTTAPVVPPGVVPPMSGRPEVPAEPPGPSSVTKRPRLERFTAGSGKAAAADAAADAAPEGQAMGSVGRQPGETAAENLGAAEPSATALQPGAVFNAAAAAAAAAAVETATVDALTGTALRTPAPAAMGNAAAASPGAAAAPDGKAAGGDGAGAVEGDGVSERPYQVEGTVSEGSPAGRRTSMFAGSIQCRVRRFSLRSI